MIFYNNLLAKCFLGKKKHYFMVGGLFFTHSCLPAIVFGSLGRNGVKNTCTAILGVFFIDFNPSIGFVTMVFMVVDGASVHDISLALLV